MIEQFLSCSYGLDPLLRQRLSEPRLVPRSKPEFPIWTSDSRIVRLSCSRYNEIATRAVPSGLLCADENVSGVLREGIGRPRLAGTRTHCRRCDAVSFVETFVRDHSGFEGLQHLHGKELPGACFDFVYDGLLRARYEVGLHRSQAGVCSGFFTSVKSDAEQPRHSHRPLAQEKMKISVRQVSREQLATLSNEPISGLCCCFQTRAGFWRITISFESSQKRGLRTRFSIWPARLKNFAQLA